MEATLVVCAWFHVYGSAHQTFYTSVVGELAPDSPGKEKVTDLIIDWPAQVVVQAKYAYKWPPKHPVEVNKMCGAFQKGSIILYLIYCFSSLMCSFLLHDEAMCSSGKSTQNVIWDMEIIQRKVKSSRCLPHLTRNILKPLWPKTFIAALMGMHRIQIQLFGKHSICTRRSCQT